MVDVDGIGGLMAAGMFVVSDYLSVKIRRVSLVMAMLVVAHHSYVGWGTPWQCLFDGVCNNSVPYFFVLSGFLMFKAYDGSKMWVRRTWTSRLRSLVIPYVFWTLAGTALMFALYFAGKWNGEVHYTSVKWWLHALGLTNAPFGNRYLWFVRRLVIFAVWAPVMGWIIRKTGLALSVGSLFVFAVLGKSADVWQSLSFFSAGVWMSLRYVGGGRISKKLLIAEIVAVILMTLVAFHAIWGIGPEHMTFDRLSRYLLTWAWIALIWHGYDFLPVRWSWFDRWTGAAFFVYCFHGLLWQLVRASNIPVDVLTCWAIIPLIVFASAGLWYCLRKTCPRFYSFISGGRGVK